MPWRSGSCPYIEDTVIEPLMLLKPSSLSHVLSMPDSGSSLVECAAQMLQCGQVCGVWVCSCVCVCVCSCLCMPSFTTTGYARKEDVAKPQLHPWGSNRFVCIYQLWVLEHFFTMTGLWVSTCCECLSIFLQRQVCVYLSTCCECLSIFLQWQICVYLPSVSAWAFFYNDRFVHIYLLWVLEHFLQWQVCVYLPAVSAWAFFYNDRFVCIYLPAVSAWAFFYNDRFVCIYLPAVSAWAIFYNDRFVSICLLWVLEHFFTMTGLCISIYLLWALEHYFTIIAWWLLQEKRRISHA